MILTHVTLNTGHVTQLGPVETRVTDLLLPIVRTGGGPVPGMEGWHIHVVRPYPDGVAFFQISDEPGFSKRPAVMAVACLNEDVADEAWRFVASSYGALRAALEKAGLWRDPPVMPTEIPWLAVWLTPFISLADVETARAFGDLERCVTWTLVEQ